MLKIKAGEVERRPQRAGILSDIAEKSVDRRSFLRGSGLAIGGLAAISATGGTVSQASASSAANGAALREYAHGERRLKYPMKKERGEWKRISWAQAVDGIGDDMMNIREQSGPESIYWLGSAKHNNKQASLFRNSKSIFIIGGNPAEAHPVSCFTS